MRAAIRSHNSGGASTPDVGDEAGHLPVLGHLGRTARAVQEMKPDHLRLVGIDGVERVGAEQLDNLVVAHGSVHAASTPCWASAVRSRFRPLLILLFTVPSGWPRSDATSR